MKHFRLLALAALLFAFPAFAANAPTATLGKADAPITIDEYASLGCPHCAAFDMQTLPALKVKYIDTGKVKLVFHHFPLDRASLDGALLTECVPAAQKWDAINLLYYQQDSWAHDVNYAEKLQGLGKMLGLSDAAVKACLANDKLRDQILQGRVDANKKLNIDGTPTLIFNGGKARVVGFQTYDQMVAVLDKLN